MGSYLGLPPSANATISVVNSSSTNLASAATFTGGWEATMNYPSLVVACITDQVGTLYVDFSDSGASAQSTLSYSVSANVNEVHRLTNTRAFYRIRFTNTSASTTTSFSLQVTLGAFYPLNSALNSTVQQDADAIIVRNLPAEFDIAQGKYTGYAIVNKFGRNTDIDTATVPEDVWNGGGAYTGFPDSTVETVQLFSASASDTAAGTGARTVRIMGLDSNYALQSETVTLNGTTPVNTVNTFRRVHTASVQTAGSGGVNVGTITCRHTTTTTNVFFVMAAGINQTNASAYTIPAGKTGYMIKLSSAIRGGTSATIDGGIWTRSFGGVFRQRRPFTAGTNSPLRDEIYGGLVFTEKSDIVIRITFASANNLDVTANYELIIY